MSTDKDMGADNQQERVPKDRVNLSHYLAGFVDGEGSFTISIHRVKSNHRFGWVIDPFFQVYQHRDNSYVLYLLKEYFGCGYVSEKGGNPSCFVYCIDRISDLREKVIPFFRKYPLIGDKYKNFLLFEEVVERLYRKEHFERDGFIDIAKLCFKMNRSGYYRKNSLETIILSLGQSSTTIRQAPVNKRGEDIV